MSEFDEQYAKCLEELRAHYAELVFMNDMKFLEHVETKLVNLSKADDLTEGEKSRVAWLPFIRTLWN